jgi:DNA uptake protein ComE-like DNA-binding protein
MKAFLAGLGLGLAASVLVPKRLTSRSRQRRGESSEPGDVHAPIRRITLAANRPDRSHKGTTQEVVRAPAAAQSEARSEEPSKSVSARAVGNPEYVLNSATRQQLLSVYGIGPVLADRIIQNRPYAAAYDVVEKGIIPESIFAQLKKQLLDQHSA